MAVGTKRVAAPPSAPSGERNVGNRLAAHLGGAFAALLMHQVAIETYSGPAKTLGVDEPFWFARQPIQAYPREKLMLAPPIGGRGAQRVPPCWGNCRTGGLQRPGAAEGEVEMRKSVVATVAFTAAAMLALTLMPVAPLSTPAEAKTIIPENKLKAACKKTPGCWLKDGIGCSGKTCFYCQLSGKGCYQAIRGTKTPSPRGDLGTLLNPPKAKTVGTNHQGTRAPLGTVGVKSTTPKGASGPILRAGGKR